MTKISKSKMSKLKCCLKCKEVKLLEDFYKDNTKSDGRCTHCKTCHKDYYRRNKEERAAYNKKWREKHPERVNATARARRRKNPKFALARNIASRIWYSLRGNKSGRHWEKLVGYTLEDLIEHFEALFKEGMTWENYGKWHMDHKVPVSMFNFTKPKDADFKKCWALDNLQPLWAEENRKKSNKITT